MLLLLSFLLAIVSYNNVVYADQWAVLVAGSSGWWNYRHQADISHAYQIMKENGLHEDKIITFMYDDIANNTDNPFPGKIFNNYQHKDVYHGVKIDYRTEMVTPSVFTEVLLGSLHLKGKGLKVLESTRNDTVFIYFADHGAPGLIAFPNDDLLASKLNETLTNMFAKQMYKELVFYVEACESGSMFEDILSTRINVYATTAANSHESSYGCFCDDKELDTCLGDSYSVNWMNDAETHDLRNWTLHEEFKMVKKVTSLSHVMEFGNMNISKQFLSKFIGSKLRSVDETVEVEPKDIVDSRKAELHSLMRAVQRPENDEHSHAVAKYQLHRALQLENLMKESFELIYARIEALKIKTNEAPTKAHSLACYEEAVTSYTGGCFKLRQVSSITNYLSKLWEMCHDGYDGKTILSIIDDVCN